MAFYKFKFGTASSSSTPSVPAFGSFTFTCTINPREQENTTEGGTVVTPLMGLPRVSTLNLPLERVSFYWQKVSASEKNTSMDYYFNLNQKLVMRNDQNDMFEILVIPGSYRTRRRRSTKAEQESYEVEISFMILRGS